MDIIETQKILHVIAVTYPNSIKVSDQDSFLLAQIWQKQFAHIQFRTVMDAVGEWMNTTNSFAPTIGQLKELIFRPDAEHADPELAWSKVKEAMRELQWDREHDKQVWMELPDEIKRCISYDELVNMAQSPSGDNDTFKKPLFAKNYARTVSAILSEKIMQINTGSDRKEIEKK